MHEGRSRSYRAAGSGSIADYAATRLQLSFLPSLSALIMRDLSVRVVYRDDTVAQPLVALRTESAVRDLDSPSFEIHELSLNLVPAGCPDFALHLLRVADLYSLADRLLQEGL